ncbi:MAG: molybdopterin-dependent oxidoreductase [Deltaproteobacteria bacterium]|nr:molybdopterin-dependent oxidoreductase [Deltaproteobacteria bacterium]
MPTTTSLLTCPLCEATCGLSVTTNGRTVEDIRGDRADVFSAGYLCPKAYAMKELEADPDRLRTPLVRRAGRLVPATWDEAWEEVERGLGAVLRDHGRDAVAVYLGNPNAHHLSGLYAPALIKAIGTRNVYSASTLDQMPKQVSAGLMFGGALSIPVPDLDRTDHLLVLGANPLASNGSLMTAPDVKGRLRALRARGGTLVVVDPRRSLTALDADAHHCIRPGTDAHLLFALVHVLVAEGRVALGRLAEHAAGLAEVERLARPFTPEAVANVTGLDAAAIRGLARDLARARRAAVYGRIGTCTQEFGTLASWLVDVLNVLTGNLDREGGAMFPKAAAGAKNTTGAPGVGRGVRFGRFASRVRGLPEVYGELPTSVLAEEIDTPGDGRIRGLVTVAGNPVLSAPNAGRLRAALATLDFMVSVDIYLNETTRHAHVVLPAPSAFERSHYDVALYQLAVRNVAHYSAPVFPVSDGMRDEWQILLTLGAIASGLGRGADVAALDDFLVHQVVAREVETPGSPVEGRDPAELIAALGARRGPDRVLDFLLRSGPYGDAFGRREGGVSLDLLERHPHGVDLGPLRPRIPEVLRTPSGKIELAPPPLVADVARLAATLDRAPAPLVLVGRRTLRSNNSWMHNLDVLVKGRPACTLHVHPDDARRLGLADGGAARVRSRVGALELPVEVTDGIMRGVVSIPHGWGHDDPASALRVAAAHAGANANLLADDAAIDPLSGNAVLSGIPVAVEPVPPA